MSPRLFVTACCTIWHILALNARTARTCGGDEHATRSCPIPTLGRQLILKRSSGTAVSIAATAAAARAALYIYYVCGGGGTVTCHKSKYSRRAKRGAKASGAK